jgi:hypothetical protein
MSEILPVMAGVVIALHIRGLAAPRWRAGSLTFLSVVCGAAASWISGELRVGWEYLVIDTAQVAIVGFVMWSLAAHCPFEVEQR